MRRLASTSLILALAAAPVWAQTSGNKSGEQDLVEELASKEEAAAVRETLNRINCKAERIEKESANMFEVDDAQCEIGQYDVKLDGEYNIIIMSRDSL